MSVWSSLLDSYLSFLMIILIVSAISDVSSLADCHSQTKTDSFVCSVKDLYLRRSCVVQNNVCSRSNSVTKTDLLSRTKPFVLDDTKFCSTSHDNIYPRSQSTSEDGLRSRSNTIPQDDIISKSNTIPQDDIISVHENSAHCHSSNSNLSFQSDLIHWSKPAIQDDNLCMPESVIQSKLPQNVIPGGKGDVYTKTEQTQNDDNIFGLESVLGIDMDLYPISPGIKNPSSRSESVIYKSLVLSTTSDILPTSHSPNSSVTRSPGLSEISLNLSEIVTDISDQIKGDLDVVMLYKSIHEHEHFSQSMYNVICY